MFNVVDAAGNLYDWLDNHLDVGLGATAAWKADIVNVGKDAALARGQVYSYVFGTNNANSSWRCVIGGGYFDDGVYAGARSLYSHAHPWGAVGTVGLRCVCDAL